MSFRGEYVEYRGRESGRDHVDHEAGDPRQSHVLDNSVRQKSSLRKETADRSKQRVRIRRRGRRVPYLLVEQFYCNDAVVKRPSARVCVSAV